VLIIPQNTAPKKIKDKVIIAIPKLVILLKNIVDCNV
jgi:hypothetical protein